MSIDNVPQLIFSLALWAAGLFVLYILIRLAVLHGIEDADRRRASKR
ncbi:hypothetical protein [Plantactinospora sp. GCM10030261]